MNPWEILLTIFGWVLLVLLTLCLIIIVLAVVVGMLNGVKRWFPKRGKLDSETYHREANRIATEGYSHDTFLAPDLIKAFNAGAHWGWGFPRRKTK